MSAVKETQMRSRQRRSASVCPDESHWTKCPTLEAFRKKLGADIVSLRKAIVRIQGVDGYLRTVASIQITRDGHVECDSAEHSLSDDEKRAIATEISRANFPTSRPAPKNSLPAELKRAPAEHIFKYFDETGKRVVFIQWRRGGEKPDLPFSYWSDDKWRMLQPEGPLPLFGLEQLKNAGAVWLHEGAKAARDVAAAGGRDHPWAEVLKYGAHLGWPGGATNAEHVDWRPIKTLGRNIRVTLVCDYDQPGIEAVTTISKILQRPLSAIFFNDKFPPGFDLADKWPTHAEWWSSKGYKGPSVTDLEVPATWATKISQRAGKGRPSKSVRSEFAAEWVWVTKPEVFIHRRRPNLLLGANEFDNYVRPFSDTEQTSRLLAQHVSSRCDGLTYLPSETKTMVTVDKQRLFNCYRPPDITAMKGDPGPFLQFIEHLVPDAGDRAELLRWCATLIARPDIRMSYGVLMVSQAQGVGKGTLGEAILAPLVGEQNVSVPDEQQVTESSFNSWLARRRLAIVHEIYAGHSAKAYNRLKSIITDRWVTVNEKYLPAYTLENMIHVYACSNSLVALRIDDDDRRWLVPRVTDKGQSTKYWRELHAWLKDCGLSIIKQWAEDFLSKNRPVEQGEHAPSTSAKREMVAAGRSDGQRLAHDLGAAVVANEQRIVLAIDDVRDWVAMQRNLGPSDTKLERGHTLRKALVAAGLQEPGREPGEEHPRYQISPIRKSYIVANFEIPVGTTWADLKEHHKAPADLVKM